ncbi:MAG: AraC family transcriptional regulator [Cytophagales bacterium]
MMKININDKRLVFLFSLFLFAFQIIVYFSFFQTKPKKVFPFSDLKHHSIGFFDDSVNNGNSKIIYELSTDSLIAFDLILNNQFEYPYCGADITFLNDEGIDISMFNRVEIEFSTSGLSHLYMYLNFIEDKLKNKDHRLALRRTLVDIHVESQKMKTALDLNSFETPDWWFEQVDENKKNLGEPNFKKLKNIAVTTGVNTPLNQLSKIEIKGIRFYRDNRSVLVAMAFIQFSVSMLFWFILHFLGTKKNELEITYKPVDLKKSKDSKTELLEFINTNFSNPDLSLKDVSKACGISPRTISEVIAEKTGMNFKTYINQIRIIEAKRLLRETELQINEVAYNVGFNSPSNFNRVFKTIVGNSPSEYIKKALRQ